MSFKVALSTYAIVCLMIISVVSLSNTSTLHLKTKTQPQPHTVLFLKNVKKVNSRLLITVKETMGFGNKLHQFSEYIIISIFLLEIF